MNRQCIQRCSAPPGPHLILALALLAPVLSFKPREVLARSTESGREAWAATSDPCLTSRGREPAIPGRPWTQCLGNPSTFQSIAAQPALVTPDSLFTAPLRVDCQCLPVFAVDAANPSSPAGCDRNVCFCIFPFVPHQFLNMNLGLILKIRTDEK